MPPTEKRDKDLFLAPQRCSICAESSLITELAIGGDIQLISMQIINIIRNLLNNKSPSSDSFTYKFYKLIEETIILVLEKLFNRILDSGILPSS